ncbi:hypothetical protein ACQPZX_38610 [Actinoplanes sp. CA-142083]|uniref:hypothetical protein n=1 Tax=Actinoplanes sp. CA-142083 TaxID=3239903 RepID=UPI003D8EF222
MEDEFEFSPGRYRWQRFRREDGIDEEIRVRGLPRTQAERSNDIARRRILLAERDLVAGPSRTERLAAEKAQYGSRSGSLPRSARTGGRRVESTSGRPGSFTRGPGLAPGAFVDAVRSGGSDAKVCGHPTCKVININHEGPADEFCPEHG